jgi:hypothetical protein
MDSAASIVVCAGLLIGLAYGVAGLLSGFLQPSFSAPLMLPEG